MKKEAVWGAAAPKMRTMLVGLFTNSCTWLKKLPARNVAKKMVSTCRCVWLLLVWHAFSFQHCLA